LIPQPRAIQTKPHAAACLGRAGLLFFFFFFLWLYQCFCEIYAVLAASTDGLRASSVIAACRLQAAIVRIIAIVPAVSGLMQIAGAAASALAPLAP